MRDYELLTLDRAQFDGEGGGGEGAAPAAETAAAETQETSVQPTPEDRRKAYKDLVMGEYKDQYTEDTQRMIDKAMRKERTRSDNLQATLTSQQGIIDMLGQRYGTTDMAALQQAIESDNAIWQQAADDAGMSVDQYRELQRLQRDNAALLRAQRDRQGAEMAQRQIAEWDAQAQEMMADYPNFDLQAEAQDPQFLSMLRSGVPVRQAYEVLHLNDIKGRIAQETARTTEKAVTDGIRAKGARPAENGTASQSSFTSHTDVSKLTKEQRAELAQRAMRGESVRL